ncbi:MAG: MFS transporter [Sphingomonadaceae bacterium]|nr:MFS transporter [Sphingomonadaceae bacterium]
MPAEAARPAGSFSALAVLLVVVFINIAGFSLILPLLPFYGREFGASPVEVTMLFSAYSLGNIFGEIHWGRASDKYGRKRVLMLTISCAAASYVAFAFAPTLWIALLIRIVSGFFSGTLGVAQSYIADVTRPEDRARNMGYFGAAFNLGFALGPALGGLLARPEQGLAGFHPPIFAAAALAAGAALWAVFALRESHAPGEARPFPHYGDAFRFVGANPLLVRLFILAFAGIGSFASMEAVFGLWTERNFGWTTREVGLAFIAVGAAGFAVQALLIGPLSRRFGEARVIVVGLAVLALSMLLQPMLRTPVAAVALMSLLMAGHSLAFPNVGALVSRATPREVQGSVLGLQMSSNALSRIVAPPFFGLIYVTAGPDAPYYAGALLIGIAVLVALQAVRIRDAQLRAESGAAT